MNRRYLSFSPLTVQPNPADASALYAISFPKLNLKGTLVNSYGILGEPVSDAIIQSLRDKTA